MAGKISGSSYFVKCRPIQTSKICALLFFFLISATVRKLQYIIVTFEQVYFAIQKRDQQPVQASEWNLSNENLSISILGQTMVTPLPRPNGNIYLYVTCIIKCLCNKILSNVH